MSPCREVINQIVQYASTEDFATGVEESPVILNHLYRPYEEVGVFLGLTSALTDGIRQARIRLAQVFETQTGDKTSAEFKLDEFQAMLNNSEKAALNELIDTLELNLTSLQNSASVCFSNLPAYEANVDETLNALLSYDKTLLQLPDPIIIIVNTQEVFLESSTPTRINFRS